MTDSPDRLATALADRYRIERELGQGGMATVYLAHDIKHDRQVAIKVLKPELAETVGTTRFLREIMVAAKLQHPHVVGLLDSGDANGRPYFAMPYIKGETLRARMAQGRLPIDIAIPILRALADAMGYAHRHGVVHRDIKPENILLSEGHALVADFGIARAFSDATGEQGATLVGVSVGTPAYMAPEQVAADPSLDHRADIYAWGVVAFELLTGSAPFTGNSPQQVMAAHVTSAPADINTLRPDLPPPIRALVMKCLAKNPADRPQFAEAIVATLDAVTGTLTKPEPPIAATRRSRRMVPVAAIIAVALVAGWWFLGRGTGTPLNSNVIAVFPFRVTGDNSAGQFRGEAVVDLLQADLPGGDKLRVISAQTAISAWQRAGGANLSDDQAVRVARGLGAGMLIQGSIVASSGQLVLNATATDLAGHAAPQTATIDGPADSVVTLVHRLAAQLLSLRAGEDSRRASYLAGVPLPAIRAYLGGQSQLRAYRFDSAYTSFSRALEIDSTFALAGLGQWIASGYGSFSGGPNGMALLTRYHDNLGPRDLVLYNGIRPRPPGEVITLKETLVSRERAAVQLGDDPVAWFLAGDMFLHWGNVAGMSRDSAFRRADRLFAMALKFDPGFGPAIAHRFDIAILLRDTLAIRRLADSFPLELKTEPFQAVAVARLRNDTDAIKFWYDTLPHMSSYHYLSFGLFEAILDDPQDAERGSTLAVNSAETTEERRMTQSAARVVAWTLGQPLAAAAHDAELRKNSAAGAIPGIAAEAVTASLFGLGDSSAASAASADIASEISKLSSPEVSIAVVGHACVVGVWRAANGDRRGVEEVRKGLHSILTNREVPAPSARISLDATICDLELAALTADAAALPSLTERLDSFALATAAGTDDDRNRLNLIVTRLWMRLRRPDRALAATRRNAKQGFASSPGLLREEGTAALAAGDTAGAVDAWSHYLRMRTLAEPAARKADDLIRQQLVAITGENARTKP